MISTILIIASVILGASADGFNEKGQKGLGHNLEALEKATLLLGGLLSGTWIVVLVYSAFRVALFDPTKNLAKGDPILYAGTIGWWDKFISKQPKIPVIFGRAVFLTFAIAVSIIYL